MKILVACEESQAVTIELRKRGHEAYSCDIQECSGGRPEWHLKQDVLTMLEPYKSKSQWNSLLYTNNELDEDIILPDKWDMIIAFPPCTHLAVSGAAWFKKKREDGRQREGIEFFMKFMNADCEKIAIENPIGIISGSYIGKHFDDLQYKYNFPIKPNQIIHPWMFGDNYSKSTCLWLKGLPELVPSVTEEPEMEYVEWVDKKTGKLKRQAKWFADAWKLPPSERSKIRSKTFPEIAVAMAEQWTKGETT